MQRIKKHQTGNVYRLTEHRVWVRDFNSHVAPLDISGLTSPTDYPIFLKNEMDNDRNDIPSFDTGMLRFDRAIIVSDGYDFKNKHKILAEIPTNVAIISVNRSLAKWDVARKIDFFLANNPYPECMSLLPSHRYYPRCLVSTRTYPEFVEKYKARGGYLLNYAPAPEAGYASHIKALCQLDDYRNPICAGISLCHKLGVSRLALLCCDDSFDGERPGAEKLENGLYAYPQHFVAHKIIDSMLNWYGKIKGVKLADHSSGPNYKDVPYIHADEIRGFFE
jgi:hypothetical protein